MPNCIQNRVRLRVKIQQKDEFHSRVRSPSNGAGERTRPRGGLSLLCVVLLASVPSGLTAAVGSNNSAPPFCVLLTAEGRVETAPPGTRNFRPAQVNQILAIGDQVRTKSRSRATLRWSDLSELRMDELTAIEVGPPPSDKRKPEVNLRSGRSYFFSREPPEEIRFRTPTASGAIRGTEFQLAVDAAGRTELALIDGEVTLRNDQNEVVLKSGEQATAVPGQPPQKRALLEAVNTIQWVLYYPAVLDPADLPLDEPARASLAPVLEAYRSGDLLQAVALYPEDRVPAGDGEKLLQAALLLAVGQVNQAQSILDTVPKSPLTRALREVIAAVKHQVAAPLDEPGTASEWLARSYYGQSRSDLDSARMAARRAVEKSPRFGPAWIRLAELEFSFGRTDAASRALEKGLTESSRHAQGMALKGFMLSARDDYKGAGTAFDQAIALDGSLANGWLGRGLVRIHEGQAEAGRKDLQVAATLEPQRSLLRSYLGKAFSQTGDTAQANKELGLARRLDPNDPTPWLYSALLKQQENRINQAVGDLRESLDRNDNRSVYRSQLLLDQDRAVRGANLASIYRDAGMFDVSVREATRAVNDDYGNYSAHLFLADSYDSLRDPKLINLRYETPWFSELLLANLLAPVGAGNLSQNISQQEYSRMFDRDHFGVFSGTEYLSSGDWAQSFSQYGVIDRSSYSLDAFYRTENGQRPNNDLEQLTLAARVKQQITEKDSVFFQALYFDSESGDVAQYYNQYNTVADVPGPSSTLRVQEHQEPTLLLGYHREWAPGVHTLFLGGRFDDTLSLKDKNPKLLFLGREIVFDNGFQTNVFLSNPQLFSLHYQSELEAYSAELQQIWQTPAHTVIAGARYQTGWSDTSSRLDQEVTGTVTDQNFNTDLSRVSFYAYDQWQPVDWLRLTAGVSYDRLEYPRNIDTSPIVDEQKTADQVSPKAGLLWTPAKDTHVRGAYTRSLGGVFFDTSVRLEPTQIAGFNQAFRSLIPESVVGLVPGTEFDTWGVSFDHVFPTRTYLGAEAEWLESEATRTVGLLVNSDPTFPVPDTASSARQNLDYRERSLAFTLNQLIERDWAVGARYKLTDADLNGGLAGLPAGVSLDNQNASSTLHQVFLYLLFNHPSGFFGQFDAVWSQQSNRDYTPDIPGDDFWQFDVSAGYRFWKRRGEVALAVLNLADQDYRLNPLTLYAELPRERTLAVRLKFFF
jgi:tetratricopeptide (TPR) repeat protein